MGKELGCEHQSIIPQGIKLHDVSCTWHDGLTALSCTVHPCDGLLSSFAVNESVGTLFQVGMFAVQKPLHDVVYQGTILVHASVSAQSVGILLQTPDGPEEHVGMFHLCHADLYGFTCHKLTDGLLGSFHHVIKFLHLIVGKRESG